MTRPFGGLLAPYGWRVICCTTTRMFTNVTDVTSLIPWTQLRCSATPLLFWFLLDRCLRTWPTSSWPTILPWLTARHVVDKPNLMRTLARASLHEKPKAFVSLFSDQYKASLMHRCVCISKKAPRAHTLFLITPPRSIHHFKLPNSIYSISFQPLGTKRPLIPTYIPPPPMEIFEKHSPSNTAVRPNNPQLGFARKLHHQLTQHHHHFPRSHTRGPYPHPT